MGQITRCTRCIMDDSSDTTISFDENGYCNYCTEALAQKENRYFPNEIGKEKLKNQLAEIKRDGAGKRYDCIMGLSGGLDSSYLAYLGKLWGLRVLAVHIDDGFDSDISKENLANLIQATGFDYMTITPDATQFNALTKAYMKAGVPNIAIPQDNVLFAFLYDCAKKYDIKYFLSGSNFSLESILQRGNTYTSTDVINIRDIHRRFGSEPIDKLKFLSTFQLFLGNKMQDIHTLTPLNYIDYNRDRAFQELRDFCGFEYYGRKHLENRLTEFIQLYWFYEKFGVDKRTSHLSSMIVSDQMSRDEALEEFNKPIYDPQNMEECIDFVKKSLNISNDEFTAIMKSPPHQHTDYKTEERSLSLLLLKVLLKVKGGLSRLKNK